MRIRLILKMLRGLIYKNRAIIGRTMSKCLLLGRITEKTSGRELDKLKGLFLLKTNKKALQIPSEMPI